MNNFITRYFKERRKRRMECLFGFHVLTDWIIPYRIFDETIHNRYRKCKHCKYIELEKGGLKYMWM